MKRAGFQWTPRLLAMTVKCSNLDPLFFSYFSLSSVRKIILPIAVQSGKTCVAIRPWRYVDPSPWFGWRVEV